MARKKKRTLYRFHFRDAGYLTVAARSVKNARSQMRRRVGRFEYMRTIEHVETLGEIDDEQHDKTRRF